MTTVARPLRIGLLMHSLNPRGGVVHTLELADALVARGHEVTVLAPAQAGQSLFRPCAATLSVAPLGPMPQGLVPMVGARMAAMAAHLRTWAGLSRMDVLHSQDSITANALATLQEEGRIPGFVRTVHHLDEFSEPELSAWQTRGVTAASRVLCVSALWQAELARRWGLRTHRVFNGVNLGRFTPTVAPERAQADAALLTRLGVQAQGPVWLAVGGVEERKNTVRLLQAFTQVLAAHPQAQLVIAGGASLLDHDEHSQAFAALCHQHSLAVGEAHADRLRVTGPLPDDALPALFRRATALLMPSLREGFGLAAVEAMACGTPAIVSRRAPFTEHLADGDVLWVDPLDVAGMAQAMRMSLNATVVDPIRARAAQAVQRMSWDRSAAVHEALYLACALPIHLQPALKHA